MRLCDAAFGELHTLNANDFKPVALLGIPAALAAFRRSAPPPSPSGSIAQRIRDGANIVHTADAKDADLYRSGEPTRRALVDLGGARTVLTVALRKDEALLGIISIYRQEVRLFSDRQIALLENFAAQAVIAMENARLLTEQQEALEQQTATAEVLQVINTNPGNLAPVFDAMLEKAMYLCEAAFGSLLVSDGESLRAAALRSVPEAFASYLRKPLVPEPGTALAQVIDERQIIHWSDARTQDAYLNRAPLAVAGVEGGGVRSLIGIPLVKDGRLLGIFHLYRQEVRSFTQKEITLLENFAAQAVIAMENARLLTEQQEALEQQTATAEVLQVINSSPGDLAPVFDAILEKAHTLCGAVQGAMFLFGDEHFRAVATRGMPEAFNSRLRAGVRGADFPLTQPLLAGERFNHIVDLALVEHPITRAAAKLAGHHTVLAVALRKDNVLLGQIVAARREVRPFSDKQIALLQNFAAQAVIAMENARLLNEVRQRQEELRITFENMGDGVAMFDETLRLVAWNRKFQEIFTVYPATPRKSGESACQAPLRRFCLIDDPRWLPGRQIAPRPD